MKIRLSYALVCLATLLWSVGFPWLAVQPLVLTPEFHVRLLQKAGGADLLARALAHELPARIAEQIWSPWIPRESQPLQELLRQLLVLVDAERIAGEASSAELRWWLGISAEPPAILSPLAAALQGSLGEAARGVLWRSLPSCSSGASTVCVPLDEADWAAVGLAHMAWWRTYTAEIAAWARAFEPQVHAGVQQVPWMRWMVLCPLAGLGQLVIAALLQKRSARWLCLSAPFLVGGLFWFLLGRVLSSGWVGPWDVAAASGVPLSSLAAQVWPALWDAIRETLTSVLSWIGAGATCLGLCFLLPATAKKGIRWAVAITALLILAAVILTYPTTVFACYLPGWVGAGSPGAACAPDTSTASVNTPTDGLHTPTPWPTLTATPTATSTPVYWPASSGTPVPTPLPSEEGAPDLLGCYTLDPEPILALSVEGDILSAFQPTRITQHLLPSLAVRARRATAWPADLAVVEGDALYLIVGERQSVRGYGWPGLAEIWQGRASVVGQITLADITDMGGVLVLITDQDRMWVLDAATGGLSTVVSLEISASALACAESRPLCLLADTAGWLATWNPVSGSRLERILPSSGVRAIALAPDGDSAVTLTEDGQLQEWRLEPLAVVSEVAIGPMGQAQLVVTPHVVAAGSDSGELIMVGERWEPVRRLVFDSAVTAITASAAGYLVVGSATGDVCILGNTAVP